jgi:GGDEF domain-containing protein
MAAYTTPLFSEKVLAVNAGACEWNIPYFLLNIYLNLLLIKFLNPILLNILFLIMSLLTDPHLIEKLGLISSIVTIGGLVAVIINFFRKIFITSPRKTIREFLFVYTSPINIVLSILLIVTYILLLLYIKEPLFKLICTLYLLCSFSLIFSFFLKQNKHIIRDLILHHLDNAIENCNGICSAVKFDIDLLVAINDYSFALGSEIINLVKRSLTEKEKNIKASGKKIVSIEIPESDEVIWILPQIDVKEAADIADQIRREVKRNLNSLIYYEEACKHVINTLKSPSLNEEERQGIGTVSAGVAAYSNGTEALLSDISSASKESKFRGRNRTIIYKRGENSIVRPH